MGRKLFILYILALWGLITYSLSGVLLFILNDLPVTTALKRYYFGLPYEAVMKSYPKIWQALAISGAVGVVLLLVLFLLLNRKKESLFGEARFANLGELTKQGLFKKGNGIIIGKYKGRLMRFIGAQFVSLGAPTRSGKGVGIVIPNLLDWTDSVVVLDIKKECFNITSRYRRDILKQEVYLFNPFDYETHRYNPLDYINFNCTTTEIDLSKMALMIYPLGADQNTNFFNTQAANLFSGLCFLLYDLQQARMTDWKMNLSTVLKLYNGYDDQPLEDFYQILLAMEEDGAPVLSERTKLRLVPFFQIDSENTKSGVVSSFNTPLMIFMNDVVKKATETSDFDLRDIRKKKMTIYLGINPSDLQAAPLVINMFFSQLVLENVKELPAQNPAIRHSCLLLMDEFTSIGFMDIILKSVSFIAGYWLRLLIIYQSKSQLAQKPPAGYGDTGATTMLDNHACQIYYAPKAKDAKEFSEMLGNKTVKNRSRSRNVGGKQSGGSENQSDVARALMLPQELTELPFNDEIIKIDSAKPIKCEKAIYYSDPYFIDKLKMVSPSLRALGKKIPNQAQLERAFLNKETEVAVKSLAV
jgi:type IV secretion system protein VirD4